ncbi:helix-turn-helix domain-containing protein [Salinicola halimionae]|uniref:helix-turn-helix domain-containing protein n=1 Tax=Salinicola halimionae TaxID=1949081 RepID=UPI000DA25EA0|nr:AraC family transcriptional regulator [Salinicola halimionae]
MAHLRQGSTAYPTHHDVQTDRMVIALSLLTQATYTLADESLSEQLGLSRVMTLLKERLPDETTPGKLAGWQTQRLTVHIGTHLHDTIRAADLAAIVRLSVGHFTHAFKMTFGETPCHYIHRLRIQQAQTLMQSRQTPLTEIALACGFCDQSHFTRLFRRATGTSPSEWRRRFGHDPARPPTSMGADDVCIDGTNDVYYDTDADNVAALRGRSSLSEVAEIDTPIHLGGSKKLPWRPSPR